MERDRKYLLHMRDAIEKIERYLADADFEVFSANDMTVDAVVRELEIIGEAARHLSDTFVAGHGDIPWHRVRAMRNVLIHEYFGVNLKIVWDTCHGNLPRLKSFIEIVLAD